MNPDINQHNSKSQKSELPQSDSVSSSKSIQKLTTQANNTKDQERNASLSSTQNLEVSEKESKNHSDSNTHLSPENSLNIENIGKKRSFYKIAAWCSRAVLKPFELFVGLTTEKNQKNTKNEWRENVKAIEKANSFLWERNEKQNNLYAKGSAAGATIQAGSFVAGAAFLLSPVGRNLLSFTGLTPQDAIVMGVIVLRFSTSTPVSYTHLTLPTICSV